MSLTRRTGRLVAVVVALMLTRNSAAAQSQAVINGKVTDAQGNGIPGANVVIPALGLSVGANTRLDGTYTITLPSVNVGKEVVLTARRIGFTPVSRTVQRILKFSLSRPTHDTSMATSPFR